MTKEDILNKAATSSLTFKFTDNLHDAVDSILRPDKDYFLNLHFKVEEIIERETKYFQDYCVYKENGCICSNCNRPKKGTTTGLCSYCGKFGEIRKYEITFEDMCKWQKELLQYKLFLVDFYYKNSDYGSVCPDHLSDEEEGEWDLMAKRAGYLYRKIKALPDMFCELGLRQTNVTINGWTSPEPIFLEKLKKMCFPISDLENDCTSKINTDHISSLDGTYTSLHLEIIKHKLEEWSKMFESIHFFNTLNSQLSSITANILSYNLTGKYLIKNNETRYRHQIHKKS